MLAAPAAAITGLLLLMGNRTDRLKGLVLGGSFAVLGMAAEIALVIGGFMAYFGGRRR